MPLGMQKERERPSSKAGFGSEWGACRKGWQGSGKLTLAESFHLNLNVVMRRPTVLCNTTDYKDRDQVARRETTLLEALSRTRKSAGVPQS